MRWTWIRAATLSACLAALGTAACSDASGPDATPPSSALEALGGQGTLQKVDGSLPEFSVEAVIGAEGGSLGVPGYVLYVSRGSVAQPTRFTFESVNDGYVEVRLTATAVGSETVNDVGAAGFTVPVHVAISYEPAGGMPRWSRLVLAWVRPGGTLERVPSYLDPVGRRVVGRLGHFSQYALAAD